MRLPLVALALVVVAGLHAQDAFSKEKSAAAPPAILLWQRANGWSTTTTVPKTDLGVVHFQQNGADVTGTFTGGTLHGTVNGRKLSGIITLPNGAGVFSVKLDNGDYESFSGTIHTDDAPFTAHAFGGHYQRNDATETGTVNLNYTFTLTHVPGMSHKLSKSYPDNGSFAPTKTDTAVLAVVVQNIGPGFLPASACHIEIDSRAGKYAQGGQGGVTFALTGDLVGVKFPSYYPFSRVEPGVHGLYSIDDFTGNMMTNQETAPIGALGSSGDRAVFGLVCQVSPDFFHENDLIVPDTGRISWSVMSIAKIVSDAPGITIDAQNVSEHSFADTEYIAGQVAVPFTIEPSAAKK